MRPFQMPLYVVFLLLCFKLVASSIGANETDRLALLEFKRKITGDPFGVMLSWNITTHFCQWYGVRCGRLHQRVTMLDLRSLKLRGSLSPHIGNMSFLRILSLQNNSFSHNVPPEIGRLRRLRVLNLHNNSIGGTIPSNISACINLVYFNISSNNLVGEIPSALGRLQNLQQLYLYLNNLKGSIPPSLGNLSSLVVLSVGSNKLLGRIPNSLGRLKNLIFFSVYDNQLTGIIPPSIFNLSYIITIDVGVNQLQGNLPSDIGITLPNLQILAASGNNFRGSIPISISNASNLEDFEVNLNKLTGKVPSLEKLHRLIWFLINDNHFGNRGTANDLSFLCSLTNATKLAFLHIHGNNFGGALPECMSNISTGLVSLTLGENQIYGSIPTWIGNLINLERLTMWDNQFTGPIPPCIGTLQKLRILSLYQNKLEGSIPSSLGNLSLIITFLLSNNNLQGTIPWSLGNCTKLLELDVSQNQLGGAITPQLMTLSSLISLNLSNNQFTGALLVEVGNLKSLGELDISENVLSGKIPGNLGSCISLESLHMQGNIFQGQIPPSLSSLRGLRVLDFSRNNLSGNIPKFLTSLDLKNVNLSYNNFEGTVPVEGIFANASATSVFGNTKLCGGIPEFDLPPCNYQASKKKGWSLVLKLTIFIVSGFLGILASSLFIWIRCKKERKKIDSSNSVKSFLMVSYQNLVKATGGFCSANLIGVGSFGSVYKGILDDGTIIAVKVFDILRRGASKSFLAECEALRNIRHRNLVKILTVCSGIDYHGKDFKALVYEFMVNGSLEKWLHPSPDDKIDERNEAPRSLSLLQRLNVAIDVASALEYLHHQCETVVVHCDLKPSNVLLDDKMTAHVGDFGLAKLLSDGIQNCSSYPSSSLALRGTIGYAPPEYGMGSEVSINGDVYSYGILLLEMFTGTKPTNEMFNDGLSLHNFVEVALPERILEIVDPLLFEGMYNSYNVSSTRKNSVLECLISVLRVGIACSVESPRERIKISDVATQLHSIRDKLLQKQSSRQIPTRNAV